MAVSRALDLALIFILAQAKDYSLGQNVAKIDLLWLKQRCTAALWTPLPNHSSYSLSPRQPPGTAVFLIHWHSLLLLLFFFSNSVHFPNQL